MPFEIDRTVAPLFDLNAARRTLPGDPREQAPAGTTPFGPIPTTQGQQPFADMPVPVYRASRGRPDDPALRQQQLETGLRREGRWSLFWQAMEVLARAEAPTAALLHYNYQQQILNGAAPNLFTWFGAALQSYATTPIGIPTAGAIGGIVGGLPGAAIGGGIAVGANLVSMAANPEKYWDDLQIIVDALQGEIRSGKMPIDIVTTLQNVRGMPTAAAYVLGIGAAMLNPADPTNWIPVGRIRKLGSLPIVVNERILKAGGTGLLYADEAGTMAQSIAEATQAGQRVSYIGGTGETATRAVAGEFQAGDITRALGDTPRARQMEEAGGFADDLTKMERLQERTIDIPLSAEGIAEQKRLTGKFFETQLEGMDAAVPENAQRMWDAAVDGRTTEATSRLSEIVDDVAAAQNQFSEHIKEVGAPTKATREMERQILDAASLYERYAQQAAGATTGARDRIADAFRGTDDVRRRIAAATDISARDRDSFENALKWLDDPAQTFRHIIDPEVKAFRDTVQWTYDTLLPFPRIAKKGEPAFPVLGRFRPLRGVSHAVTPIMRGAGWRSAAWGSMGLTFGALSVEPEDSALDVTMKALFGGALMGLIGARALGNIDQRLLTAYRALETGKPVTAKAEAEIRGALLRHFGGEGVDRFAKSSLRLYGTVSTYLGEKWSKLSGIPRGSNPHYAELAENLSKVIRLLRSADSTQSVIGEQISRNLEIITNIAKKEGREVDAAFLNDYLNDVLELKDIDIGDVAGAAEEAGGGPAMTNLPVPVEEAGLPTSPRGPQTPVEDLEAAGQVPPSEPPLFEPGVDVDMVPVDRDVQLPKGKGGPEYGTRTVGKKPKVDEAAAEEAKPLTPEETQEFDDAIRQAHEQALGDHGVSSVQVRESLSDAISSAMNEDLPEYTADQMTRRVLDILQEEHGIALPEPLLESDLYVHVADEVHMDMARRARVGEEIKAVRADPVTRQFVYTHLGTEDHAKAIAARLPEARTTPTAPPAGAIPEATGADSVVRAPDKPQREVAYLLMEVQKLVGSHGRIDGGHFNYMSNAGPERGYPGRQLQDGTWENANTRNYTRDNATQRLIDKNFQNPPGSQDGLDVTVLLNDLTIATEGPPILAEWAGKMVVVGGNARFLRLLRMYADSTSEVYRETYKARLLLIAGQVGVDPQAIEAMTQPVLVRVLKESPNNYEDMRGLIDEFNVERTQATNSGVRIGIRLRKLPEQSLDQLQALIDDIPEDAQLAQVVRSQPARAREILSFLRGNDLVDEGMVNRIYDDTPGVELFTQEGGDFIRDMMMAMVTDNPSVTRLFDTHQSIGSAHVRGARWLREIDTAQEGFQADLERALVLYDRYLRDTAKKDQRTPFNKWIEYQQQLPDIFTGGSSWPDDVTARQNDLLQWIHSKARSPMQMATAYRDYAQFLREYESGQGVFTAAADQRNPVEAFSEIFGKKANARDVARENIRMALAGEARIKYQDDIAKAIKAGNIDVTKGQLDEYMVVSDAMGRAAMRALPERYPSLDDWYKRPVRATGEAGPEGALGSVGVEYPKDAEPVLVLTLFKDANLSTLLHEDGHLLRTLLSAEDMATVENVYSSKGIRARTLDFDEQFAEDFEVYMKTGRAPTAGLRSAFDKIAGWLTDIFRTLRERWGTGFERSENVDDRVRDIFDRYLGTSEDDVIEVKRFEPANPGQAPTREDLIGHYAHAHNVTASMATAVLDAPTAQDVKWLNHMAEQYGNAEEFEKARQTVANIPEDPGAQGALMQRFNRHEGITLNAEEVDSAMARVRVEMAQYRVGGDVTPDDILSGRIMDDVVQHVVAWRAGLGGNSQFINAKTLRGYFRNVPHGAFIEKMFKVARRELGISDDTEDLFLAYLSPLIAMRGGYRALHMAEQWAGLNAPSLMSEFVEYASHMVDRQARRNLQNLGVLEKAEQGTEGLNVRASFSLFRKKRSQFFLLDTRYTQMDEGGRPQGLLGAKKAFMPLDDDAVEQLVKSGHLPEGTTRETLLAQKDQGLRDAFRIELAGGKSQEAHMAEDAYFNIRMGREPIQVGDLTFWPIEVPFSDLPLTIKNRLYRSHTLRTESIEQVMPGGKDFDYDDYVAKYFDHDVRVVGTEAGEPLLVEDAGIAYAARIAGHRRVAAKMDLLAATLGNPWYGKAALTASPNDWERQMLDVLNLDMEYDEAINYIRTNYALAHAGGEYYFILERKTGPLAEPSTAVLRMDEVFEGQDSNVYRMVHITRDAQGEMALHSTFDSAADADLLKDGRLRDTKARDAMSWTTIRHSLEHAGEIDERTVRGAEKALLVRTTAVADAEVARLLNDSYQIYEPQTNKYRGVWTYMQERFQAIRQDPSISFMDAWRMATEDTKTEYGGLGLGAKAWAPFEWLTTQWARMTISGFPATRVRDILGNFNTMALSGFDMFNPDDLGSLWQSTGLLRGNRITVRIGDIDYDGQELMQELVREGILTGAYTGSDLHLNDAVEHAMALDYRHADKPYSARDYYEELLLGRQKVGDKWVFTGLKPGTAMLYRNVLIPSAIGAGVGASLEEGDPLRGALRGGLVGGALGTAFGASRIAAGNIQKVPGVQTGANRFTTDTLNVRNKKMVETFRGSDSGFGFFTRTTGAHFENLQKAAFYLSMRKRGFSPTDAALRVHQAIMTPLSVPVGIMRARPLMPFLRWTAFNLPMQYRGFLEKPRVAVRLGKGLADMQSNYHDPDNLYIPSWIVGQPHILLSQDPKSQQYQYFALGNWIPSFDIAEQLDVKNWDRVLPSLLTPILTTGLEQAANRNLYFDRPIDRFADFGERGTQMEQFLGVNIPSKAANVLGKIRLFRELNILSGRDPFEFLEKESEKNERKARRGELRRELSTKSIILSAMSSGLGFLPKLYHIDVDRNKNLVIWRVRDSIKEVKSIYRYAKRQQTTSGEAAQLQQIMNPLRERIPGFETQPIDYLSADIQQELQRISQGE